VFLLGRNFPIVARYDLGVQPRRAFCAGGCNASLALADDALTIHRARNCARRPRSFLGASRLLGTGGDVAPKLLKKEPSETAMNPSDGRCRIWLRYKVLDSRIKKIARTWYVQNCVPAPPQEIGHSIDVCSEGSPKVEIAPLAWFDAGFDDRPEQPVPNKHKAHLPRRHHERTGLKSLRCGVAQQPVEGFALLISPNFLVSRPPS